MMQNLESGPLPSYSIIYLLLKSLKNSCKIFYPLRFDQTPRSRFFPIKIDIFQSIHSKKDTVQYILIVLDGSMQNFSLQNIFIKSFISSFGFGSVMVIFR